MDKIKSFWYAKKSEFRVMLVGNAVLSVGFLALLFGFFTGQMDLPLGVLLACPFVNLNYYLYARSMDAVLENKGSKGKVRIDFIWRYLLWLLPVIISLVLWYYSYYIFNPVVIGISLILYRFGIYLPITRFEADE